MNERPRVWKDIGSNQTLLATFLKEHCVSGMNLSLAVKYFLREDKAGISSMPVFLYPRLLLHVAASIRTNFLSADRKRTRRPLPMGAYGDLKKLIMKYDLIRRIIKT